MTTTPELASTPHAAWTDGIIYSFDMESTSPEPRSAHAISATIVKLKNQKLESSREWFLAPEVEIPEGATAIHGITTEQAREKGGDPKEAIEEITKMVAAILNGGYPLVIFNAAYDLTLLEAQARHFGVPSLNDLVKPECWVSVIDAMVLSKGLEHFHLKEFVKGRNFKLPSVCERYGVPFVESHDATADAIGAGLAAIAIINRDPILSEKGPKALFELQQKWRKKAQHGLRIYFDKNKIAHDGVDTGWPMHSDFLIEEVKPVDLFGSSS